MANIKSQIKRNKTNEKARERNKAVKSELRTVVRQTREAISAGDKAAATAIFQQSVSTVDSIADKKIIHKNKAARHKSRLAAALKAMSA